MLIAYIREMSLRPGWYNAILVVVSIEIPPKATSDIFLLESLKLRNNLHHVSLILYP